MAIAELAQDLIAKLKSVPAMGNRVGLATAGRATDPSMKRVPMPAAWVLFDSDTNTNPDDRGFLQTDIDMTFSVFVMLSYTSEADLINMQLVTLEDLARAASGKDSTNFGMRWKYLGCQLLSTFSDRLVYELKYLVSTSYQ
jgi:hypothetical protein